MSFTVCSVCICLWVDYTTGTAVHSQVHIICYIYRDGIYFCCDWLAKVLVENDCNNLIERSYWMLTPKRFGEKSFSYCWASGKEGTHPILFAGDIIIIRLSFCFYFWSANVCVCVMCVCVSLEPVLVTMKCKYINNNIDDTCSRTSVVRPHLNTAISCNCQDHWNASIAPIQLKIKST